MSSSPEPAPRRSGRERKQAEFFKAGRSRRVSFPDLDSDCEIPIQMEREKESMALKDRVRPTIKMTTTREKRSKRPKISQVTKSMRKIMPFPKRPSLASLEHQRQKLQRRMTKETNL